jgi:hypothetical protein
MAGHVGLLKNLMNAATGKPLASVQPLNFSGSMNYGLMRLAATIAGDRARAPEARRLWLGWEREQLSVGHHSRAGQCEQLEPQPHSEFVLGSIMVVWRTALRNNDVELAQACEANIGRCVALYRAFNVAGVVGAPSARAKDPEDSSSGSKAGQWRSRPADGILSRVIGTKRPKYDGLSVSVFDEILSMPGADGEGLRSRLATHPLPLLRIPVKKLVIEGEGYPGYRAWMEPTEAAVKILGRDALSGVIHRVGKDPELFFDWKTMPPLPEGAVVETIGERLLEK